MENDPEYKKIEEVFYRQFDASIKAYIGGIQKTIDHYKQERELVLEKI